MQAFDELLLLKRGGETIFCGPIGQDSATLIAYFRSYRCRWIVGPGPAQALLDYTCGA